MEDSAHTQEFGKAYRILVIENMVTIVSTAALVAGLFYMGAGGWSFAGLTLLLNINQIGQSS
jgi:hypothetical protein